MGAAGAGRDANPPAAPPRRPCPDRDPMTRYRLRHSAAPLSLLCLCLALAGPAQAEAPRYVSDEITLSVRDAPRNDAGFIGLVRSGEAVTLLESLGEQSFARIRLANGSEGWVASRYLSETPAARSQLDALRGELAEAEARGRALDQQVADLRGQLEQARPAMEMARENQALQATIDQLQADRAAIIARFDAAESRRRMLITGASLLGGGLLAGLLLPLLLRGRRRRGDF